MRELLAEKPPLAVLCATRKETYPTEASAERHREEFFRALVRRGGRDPTTLRVYRCPHCDLWHISSSPDRDDVRQIERAAPFVPRLVFDLV